MKNRKIITVLLLCILVTFLVGCSSGKAAQDENTIRIVYPTSRAMGDKDISVFKEWFEEKYPGVKLDMVSSAITTVSDTVSSEFKNGNGPDIFVTTEYDSFVQNGYLADITAQPALTKFKKSSVRGLERDGRVYALPMGGGNMVALHYNKTMFDKYGLEYPKSTETLYDVVLRVSKVIDEEELDVEPIGASMLYPSQASAIINGALSEYTQTDDYLRWITSYGEEGFTFKDPVFQKYVKAINRMINEQEDADGNPIADTGRLFDRDDYFATQSSSISSFLNGGSFMYLGDVNRTYATYGKEGNYDQKDMAVMGIPCGIKGVEYISYMDDIYLGVNGNYDQYSDDKKEIISDVINYISNANYTTRNIFTFTGNNCSVYLEGKSVDRSIDPYFKEIYSAMDGNYVAQEVNNTPFSNIFGKIILSWRKGELDTIVEGDKSDIEKVTEILEKYSKDGVNMFAKSEKPIGKSKYFMEYNSNVVRTQETALGNQVADMARDYMGADFALVNAGGIRASIPKGEISTQTINSLLPYTNHVVKIKVSGKTLKKAIAHAYDVGPLYKSGQFGAISGLKVKLKTNDAGYKEYSSQLARWKDTHADSKEIQENAESKDIVEKMCADDETRLNLVVVSITDADGNAIQDDKTYTVATLDYLLLGEDGYDMLGVLGDTKSADKSIEIYDKDNKRISGSADEMIAAIEKQCDTSADAFVNWVKAGNVLQSKVDGRIKISHFIYVE